MSGDAADAGLPQPARALAVAAVLGAMTLVVLDAGMVNVALPTLARTLGARPAHAVLVVTAYQAALVMALLPCAALGERFGHARVFRAGVAVFVTGSLLCALAPALPLLVLARFLQGLGGAAVMALGVALLRFSVSDARLGSAVGWNALTVALSSAAAPAVGSMVIARLDWPWLFLINLPVGALVLGAGRRLPSAPVGASRLDGTSMGLNAAAFGLLVLGAEALTRSAPVAAGLWAGAATAFALLVRREGRKARPLFPLDLLKAPSFRVSVIASVCCFSGQAAAMIALPFYLQHSLGLPAGAAGLYLSPWPLSVAATSVAAGRLSSRVPTAWLCALGGAVLAVGLGAIAAWPQAGPTWPVLTLSALCGVGFGFFQVPNNRNMFLAAPAERSGAAGGLQGTARLTGQVSGAIVMTLLFTVAPAATAARWGLGLGAAFALAAGVVSLARAGGVGEDVGSGEPSGGVPELLAVRRAPAPGLVKDAALFGASPRRGGSPRASRP